MASLPRINNQAHQLWVLEMDLPDDPMKDSLAGPIRRRRERAHLHTSDTPQGASNTNELGPLTLLQQWKRGLEKEQRSKSIDSDMLLDNCRVTGSDRCVVVANASVGDDDVEGGDSLVFDRGYSVDGVGLALVIDFHNDEFAGGVLGDGGELLRCRMFRVADAGDDGGGGAGEVGLDEAEADAWVLLSRANRKGTKERSRDVHLYWHR